MSDCQPQFLDVAGRRIAVRLTPGAGPAVVWMGGFRSDMLATKATHLAEWGARTGRAVVRFDYAGHGESEGRFEDGTISRWLEDSLAVIAAYGGDAPVLVGSSMGGWLALLAARQLSSLGGLVLIAPAVDFTEALMWAEFSPEIRETILRMGFWMRPSAYSAEPYPITRDLIEDGRRHLMFGAPFQVNAPVRILQGMQDPDVPWPHAMTLMEHLAQDDAVISLIRDGDHRLSRPQDLDMLVRAIENL